MGASYKPLWKLLIDRNLKKKDLISASGISVSTMNKMGRSEYVALEILERIAKALDCKIQDIVEFTGEEKE